MARWLAILKPIGVSTQFVIFDGIIADWFIADTLFKELITEEPLSKSGYASANAYLDKSAGKYAKAVAQPLNYSFVFVIAMMVGGFIGALLGLGWALPLHSSKASADN